MKKNRLLSPILSTLFACLTLVATHGQAANGDLVYYYDSTNEESLEIKKEIEEAFELYLERQPDFEGELKCLPYDQELDPIDEAYVEAIREQLSRGAFAFINGDLEDQRRILLQQNGERCSLIDSHDIEWMIEGELPEPIERAREELRQQEQEERVKLKDLFSAFAGKKAETSEDKSEAEKQEVKKSLGYPLRKTHMWTVRGDDEPSRAKLINHLTNFRLHKNTKSDPKYPQRVRFEEEWLKSLSWDQLMSLHSDDHEEMERIKEGRRNWKVVHWNYVNKWR